MMLKMTFLRLLMATLLLVGQVAFALGGGMQAAASAQGDEIVICTPTGLKLIRLSADGEPVEPTTVEGVVCPACVLADLTPPATAPVSVARTERCIPAKYAHAVSTLHAAHVDLPYLTRAPPV